MSETALRSTFDIHEGAIALLTFNRPEKMNALNTALLQEFDEHLAPDRVRSRAARGDPDRGGR